MADEIINSLIDDLKNATIEEIDENLDFSTLKLAAQNFINSYNKLLEVYQNQLETFQKQLLNTFGGKENKGTFMYNLSKSQNAELLFVRSKYLLAFKFDAILTKFRGQVPKKGIYVFVGKDDEGNKFIKPIEMSMINLVQLIDRSGRFGDPALSTLTKLGEEKEIESIKKEEKRKEEHKKQIDTAYFGTINRLNVFYTKAKLTGANKQAGLLMWKEQKYWMIAKVLNEGDIKEAYAAAFMTKHKSKLDKLCNLEPGEAPYYSHELISSFFNNYIGKVTNKPAIMEEDVKLKNIQYAIKGSKASAPEFDQYLKIANEIIKEKGTIKNLPTLEAKMKEMFYQDAVRNTMQTTIDEVTQRVVRNTQRKLNSNKK